MSIGDLEAELLRAEYPFLRPDHDPDIERYFELRAIGNASGALALYHARLLSRYPSPEFRTSILRAYRLRDPSYPLMAAAAYNDLAKRLLERTKRVIKYAAMFAVSFDQSDVYATIRAAESILRLLPRDRFEAVSAIERLRRYADNLSYRSKEMAIAEELVRAYLNEQLDVVEAERSRRQAEKERGEREARRRLIEADRKPHEPKRPKKTFDLSSIRFSAADIARIQIPPRMRSVEDKTLAFCFKYWNLTEDKAFERVLFLYSRKHGVTHYEVYSTIRDGRRLGKRDEEILSMVSGLLTTGYYYSIRGDIYLQHNWARLKSLIETNNPTISTKPRLRRQSHAQPTVRGKTPAAIPLVHTQPISAVNSRVEANATEMGHSSPPQKSIIEMRGSVSDRLKKLSGKSYDVYQDRFLIHARPAIRTVLSSARNAQRSLFVSIPQEAEELVFDFLRDHYSNPYMDWASSTEKKNLSKLGFELDSVDIVIEECFRRL